MEEDGRFPGIAGKELTGSVVGSVDGFTAHLKSLLFIGVANLIAACWVVREKRAGNSRAIYLLVMACLEQRRGCRALPSTDPKRDCRRNYPFTRKKVTELGKGQEP